MKFNAKIEEIEHQVASLLSSGVQVGFWDTVQLADGEQYAINEWLTKNQFLRIVDIYEEKKK